MRLFVVASVYVCVRATIRSCVNLFVRAFVHSCMRVCVREMKTLPFLFLLPGRDLILNLKFTEIQAAAAEREAAKLSQELELLVAELNEWKEKYGEICVELEQTFNEMAGY